MTAESGPRFDCADVSKFLQDDEPSKAREALLSTL